MSHTICVLYVKVSFIHGFWLLSWCTHADSEILACTCFGFGGSHNARRHTSGRTSNAVRSIYHESRSCASVRAARDQTMSRVDLHAANRLLMQLDAVGRIFHTLDRREPDPDRRLRSVAVLVFFLSRSTALAMLYLLARSSTDFHSMPGLGDAPVEVIILLDWFRDTSIQHTVMAAISALDHPVRVVADSFLMQTCLVGFIVAQSRRGLTVDLPEAIHVYLRLWSYRPMSDRTARHLRRLAWHRNTRRRFGVILRGTFMLSMTTLPLARDLTREELCARVFRRF